MCKLILLLFCSGVLQASYAYATIYGNDSFQDIYQVQDQSISDLSNSVAVLIRNNSIRSDFGLRSRNLLSANVCEFEKFVTQPVTSFCTGTLISPKHILTASHCYSGIESVCANAKWVFDYKYQFSDSETLNVDPHKIYSCQKIVKGSYLNNLDYMVIELDRIVTDIKPVEIDFEPLDENFTHKLIAITSPRGLPLKYSEGVLRKNTDENHFVSNIDLMRGSSGGPILDPKSNKLVGVVAQGDYDYITLDAPFCNAFNRCDEDGCMGESATRVSRIEGLREIVEQGYIEQSHFLGY